MPLRPGDRGRRPGRVRQVDRGPGRRARPGPRYLDTGSTYRALTWWLLSRGVDVSEPDAVIADIGRPAIEVGTDPAAPAIRVDGSDVAGPIRTREVSNAVSAVAAIPQVRGHLVAMQQAIIADA